MKNLCLECEVDCKIEYCCSFNPETGESVQLELNDGKLLMLVLVLILKDIALFQNFPGRKHAGNITAIDTENFH